MSLVLMNRETTLPEVYTRKSRLVFMALRSLSISLVGTEGGDGSVPGGRAQLWASGELQAVNNTADFNVTMAGILDWGKSSYAAASKVAPSDITASHSSGAPDRQICAIWITSDFFGGNPYPCELYA